MSLPTLEQYKNGATTWKREYKGINYILSHHGVSDYSYQGTWCFYIYIYENMFLNDEDFKIFLCEPQVTQPYGDSFWESYPYHNIPDYGFYGGITFYSLGEVFDRQTGKRISYVKIGCDYAHSWDRDSGYYQGLDEVEQDAKRLIDKLAEQHPVKTKCSYSGKLGFPQEFYKSKLGKPVLKTYAEKLKEDGLDNWTEEDNS